VHRLLGKIKITEQADQSCQDSSRIHAIKGVEQFAYLLGGTLGHDNDLSKASYPESIWQMADRRARIEYHRASKDRRSPHSRAEAHGKSEGEKLNKRLLQVRRRIEPVYLDKLDGKITETFWAAKSSEWNHEEQEILAGLAGLRPQNPEKLLNGVRTLELANKAYFLHLKQPPAEKEKLLRIVLSNCKIDAASVDPTYRKPFDLIFQRGAERRMAPRARFELATLRLTALKSKTISRCAAVA
jgi:hypothetical protein